MPQNPTYDIMLEGVGLTLARAEQLQEGARAWKVEITHNPVSATTPDSAKYGGVGQQIEMPLVWDDLSGGYGSWNDRIERKYHWGYGVDCRFPKMVLSGPLLTPVTLTTTDTPPKASTAPASDFEEHDSKLWVIGGRYVYAITPATYAVEAAFDAGSGKTVTDLEEWKTVLYAARGFGSGEYIASHATGAAVGTWTTDGDVQRGLLWPLWDEMYGTDSTYSVSKVATDPMTLADWSASYTIGDTGTAITSLATLEDELYVGKRDGVHGLDTSGIGTMLSPELRPYRCAVNCKGMKVWHGTLIVPHLRGLLQYTSRGDGTHSVTPIGPGRGALRDNPIRGHITALAGDEKYLYVALWTGAYGSTTSGHTYILAGCPDSRSGEWAWHPLIKFPDDKRCDAMHISGLWANPHLWMGYGNDVAYIKLPRGQDNPALDGNCTYALTGTLRYQRHDLNAPASYKLWKSIEMEADNLSPVRYITVYTRVDNGTWQNWGNAYQSPRTLITFGDDGLAGKTLELRLDFTMPNSETPIILRSACLRAAERPDAIETITAVVRCDDKIGLRNSSRNSRTGAQIWTALQAMLAHNGAVTLVDPLGIEKQVLVIAPLEQSEARSEGDVDPEYLATVRMVRWEATDVNMRMLQIEFGYSANGWEVDWEIGWNVGATVANTSRTINYEGTAATRPTIALTGPINSFVMTNVTTGQTLCTTFNQAPGEVYTIDCTAKTILNKSETAVSGVTVNDFWLVPGNNTITITGTGISANTACKMTYRTENVIA